MFVLVEKSLNYFPGIILLHRKRCVHPLMKMPDELDGVVQNVILQLFKWFLLKIFVFVAPIQHFV